MTTTDHLQRIRARCVELLALAEKRTPGEWGIERTRATNWIGPMRQNGDGKINTIVCDTNRDGLKRECVEQNDADATFIAACADSAEAGWRSTIAAIDAISAFVEACETGKARSKTNYAKQKAALEAIIAAWPEELL